MAGPAPKTQGWSARENRHERTGMHLIVSGSVEVDATNKRALLTEGPQIGKVLPLNLSIEEVKIKKKQFKTKQIVVWTEAYFHKTVGANKFDQVEIRWDEAVVAAVPVIDDGEHTAQRAEQMEAVNAQSKGVKAPEATPRVIE